MTTTKAVPSINNFPCQDFVCLLKNFDLLKTDDGYLLESGNHPSSSNCVTFECWIRQFRVEKSTYGYKLTFKNSKKTNDFDFDWRFPSTTPTSIPSTSAPSFQFEDVLNDDYSYDYYGSISDIFGKSIIDNPKTK